MCLKTAEMSWKYVVRKENNPKVSKINDGFKWEKCQIWTQFMTF